MVEDKYGFHMKSLREERVSAKELKKEAKDIVPRRVVATASVKRSIQGERVLTERKYMDNSLGKALPILSESDKITETGRQKFADTEEAPHSSVLSQKTPKRRIV